MKEVLRQGFGGRVRFDEPLRRHTSFRIGGPADAWVEVESAREIWEIQRLAAEARIDLWVMGTGTNVLVSDRGVRGLVVRLGAAFTRLVWRSEGERVCVRAGAALPFKKLVVQAARRGLGGLEFAEGIPGSVGGGLLMNAGAFGGEISNVVERVVGVDPASGERTLDRSELRFDYRRFDLPPGLIVTHVDFQLSPADHEVVRERMQDARRRRTAKQPLGWPNAGSVFKNPPGDYAGRLIEASGMKGRRVGGAMVSERHANFIVNVGRATAADVKQLMDEIADRVWQANAIRLVPEIKLVGEWGPS
jgi:UDP-N-acetylmuramate dehydrogenase